jgi:hypothetical protein
MKYLFVSLMLLAATPVQAEVMGTQACLQVIRDYWPQFDKTGNEPGHLYDKFASQCKASKELDDLMLNDEYINTVTARLAEKGLL